MQYIGSRQNVSAIEHIPRQFIAALSFKLRTLEMKLKLNRNKTVSKQLGRGTRLRCFIEI